MHTPEMLLNRAGLRLPERLADELGYQNALRFDAWTNRRIGTVDAFIGISGAGLNAGRTVRQRGGKFIYRVYWKFCTVLHPIFGVYYALGNNRCFIYSTGASAQCRVYTPFFTRWSPGSPSQPLAEPLRPCP
jgi:hypothetical protein